MYADDITIALLATLETLTDKGQIDWRAMDLPAGPNGHARQCPWSFETKYKGTRFLLREEGKVSKGGDRETRHVLAILDDEDRELWRAQHAPWRVTRLFCMVVRRHTKIDDVLSKIVDAEILGSVASATAARHEALDDGTGLLKWLRRRRRAWIARHFWGEVEATKPIY
jgi:hypothetical protein